MTDLGRLARRTLLAATAATMGALGLAAPAPASATPAASPGRAGPATPVPLGATCYAGVYACRLPALQPAGSGCACPGIGAPSYGSVR